MRKALLFATKTPRHDRRRVVDYMREPRSSKRELGECNLTNVETPRRTEGHIGMYDEFKSLLEYSKGESELQLFLEKHPEILRRTFNLGAAFPTVFPKFCLADEFIPDFAIIGHRSSWMWNVDLIEIEPANLDGPLFNKKRQSTGRLRDAESQIKDWQAWMAKYGDTVFVRRALKMLKERQAWDKRPEFYHLPDGVTSQAMTVMYRIVIGRRTDFEGWGTEYQELIWRESGHRIEIVPWDRLLDKAKQIAVED